MPEWFSIEVFDGARSASARAWAERYGDALVYAAQLEAATDWHWQDRPWGVVLEVEVPDEAAWERFRDTPAVRAALDAVPDPVLGLILHRGLGGSDGIRQPRRPRPRRGAGACALPIPDEAPTQVIEPPRRVLATV